MVASFLTRDLPELLTLGAKALRKMRLPSTYAGFLSLSQSEVLDLTPVLCFLFVAFSLPFALLHAEGRPRTVVAEPAESYWLTRLCLLRGLGLCYLCGFLTSAFQHRALWGSKGLQPISVSFPTTRPTPAFELLAAALPSVPFDCLLEGVSWLGVLLSALLLWSPIMSFALPASLWVLYLSIINLQAPFTYSYGWEWLTCEAGFLAIFLCPLPLSGRFPASAPPPRLVIWLFRWLAFRLLLGAGMSKVGRNSSACWRQLTCTTMHYFTQPIPNPLSWFAHHAPEWVHKAEVALTFVEQLALPFLMLVPLRWCRRTAGLLEGLFQLLIVATGNYAWINFIGALPCISMLDDAVLSVVLPRSLADDARKAAEASLLRAAGLLHKLAVLLLRRVHGLVCVGLVLFMAYKSKDPLKELFSAAPWINNYDQWFLMNSQGVFGFINAHRVNLVLEYTHGKPREAGAEWKPLDFKCIPGSVDRLPCLLSPYHSRLDWETWIRTTASMEHLLTHRAPPQEYFDHFPAFLHELIMRLLHGDDDSISLMGVPRSALLAGGVPPTGIRARFYSYTFTAVEEWRKTGHWWHREPLDDVGGLIFEASQQPMKKGAIRSTPPGRTRALLVAVLGILCNAAAAREALQAVAPLPLLSLATTGFLGFAGAALAALLTDYPKVFRAAVVRPLRDHLGVPRVPGTGWELMQGIAVSLCAVNGFHLAALLYGQGIRGGTAFLLRSPAVAAALAGPGLLVLCYRL